MLDNKYKKWYFKIIENAIQQKRKKLKRNDRNYVYYERHHIIPKCFGGNKEDNLVLLTAKEHYICHLLLCKFTTGKEKYKMINAIIRMAFSKSNGQERYYSAKNYEKVRTLIAEKNSALFKGKRKSIEMRKKLSKSRKGMKFSNKHKENLSLSRMGKRKGSENPFFGKKHSHETKKKFSEKRKGVASWNSGTKGKYPLKWYNNGIICKMFRIEDVPENWILGRVSWRKK